MDIGKIELGWKYNQKAIKIKGTKTEINILKEAVSKSVETPYTYNRLSILLSKEGKRNEAIEVCKKYQIIMNKRLKFRRAKGYTEDISPTERAILKRLNSLDNKSV